MLSPSHEAGQHLRVLGQLAARVDEGDFLSTWLEVPDAESLKEALLRHEHSVALHLKGEGPTAELVGRAVRELDLPEGVLIGLVRRDGRNIIPRGGTRLEVGDRLLLIGDPEPVDELFELYVGPPVVAPVEEAPEDN